MAGAEHVDERKYYRKSRERETRHAAGQELLTRQVGVVGHSRCLDLMQFDPGAWGKCAQMTTTVIVFKDLAVT